MQGRATRIVATALAALVVVSLAGPTRASAIPSSYRLTPLGSDIPWVATSPSIDEEGNVGAFFKINSSTGDYRIEHVYDPDVQGRTIEVRLLKSGSDVNLLPEPLRSPLMARITGINAKGGVVGNYVGNYNGSNARPSRPFYYNVETKELVDLKNVPGAVPQMQAYGINDHGQIVGHGGFKATLYASPEAVPVELIGLLADVDGWNLHTATDINNRGEIVGYGSRAVMDDGYYGTGFYKLSPQAVPEPSSIVVFVALGLLGAGFAAIGRRRRSDKYGTSQL